MASLNKKETQHKETNCEGVFVKNLSANDKLKRLTFAHMLFEDQFYVDGKSSHEALVEAVNNVSPAFAAQVAKDAKTKYKLRHVPLAIILALVAKGKANAQDITDVITRADEMGELLAQYNKDGKKPLANCLKKGIAKAFHKFDEYQFAKNDKNNAAYSVRDVMFLVHPKPTSEDQAVLFKKIANQELDTPDTWETQLSAGADKKETFERLMAEKKLGTLAFLRNLRNMSQAGIDEKLIRDYGSTLSVEKTLPFRFIAAARAVPQFEDMLEKMMFKACANMDKIEGSTDIVIDVSGSMFGTKVSAKSELDRFDAAAALAVLLREVCPDAKFYTFSYRLERVAPRRGFALVEALRSSQEHGGTHLSEALDTLKERYSSSERIIIITDEQENGYSTKSYKDNPPSKHNYILNVGAYKNGINSDKWETITGFSEAVLSYILELEAQKSCVN